MRLPKWFVDGETLLYIYRKGNGRLMDVYYVCGGESYYAGTHPCHKNLCELEKLESPWKEIMERRRFRYD